MYTCKDNLIPFLYSGKIKKKMNLSPVGQVTAEVECLLGVVG